MMSSEFLALRRGLMSLIREESLKAMGGEISDLALQGLSIDLHGQSLADVIERATPDLVATLAATAFARRPPGLHWLSRQCTKQTKPRPERSRNNSDSVTAAVTLPPTRPMTRRSTPRPSAAIDMMVRMPPSSASGRPPPQATATASGTSPARRKPR